MSIEDFLKKQAEKQLDKATSAVSEGAWLDKLVSELRTQVDSAEMDDALKAGSNEAINALEANKAKVTGLGADALALMVAQLAAGKNADAADTYMQAHGSAELIIEAMDRGTQGLILAKRALDAWYEDAWQVIKDVTVSGAKALLPFLLALI